VIQISSLIGTEASGVVCAKADSMLDKNKVYVLGAGGEFAPILMKG
jgi:hypothetical protein